MSGARSHHLVRILLCTQLVMAGANLSDLRPEALAAEAATISGKPHVFLVLVDDLGWSNIGYRAGRGFKGSATKSEAVTPVVDGLIRKGILLNRHYTYNFCSPSRAALQSGRLPVHVSYKNIDASMVNPDDPVSGFAGIPRNMTGIATKMRQAGYRTHMTGKWDAGFATYDHTPMGRGYETFFGYFHHANDYYTQTLSKQAMGRPRDICQLNGMEIVDLWNTKGPAYGMNGTVYEEDMFKKNTLGVIAKHDPREPLFLFHSFHVIHTPLQVPAEQEAKFSFLKNRDRRLYAAMVNYMDTALGEFVEAFKRKSMWNNTLLILSSDNGGPIYGVPSLLVVQEGSANNIPLKGGKLSDWEGGIRVNAFVSGGYLPPSLQGTQRDGYMHIADWYATLCDIAGISPSDDVAQVANLPAIDSMSMWPYLLGKEEASPRTEIHISEHTLIQGDYKLLTGGGMVEREFKPYTQSIVPYNGYWPGWGWQADLYSLTQFKNCAGGCLYNIRKDPYEKRELSKKKPHVLRRMLLRLKKLNKSIFRPNRGKPDIRVCHAWKGFYGPWVH